LGAMSKKYDVEYEPQHSDCAIVWCPYKPVEYR
jgi:hypothetical protein